MSNRVETYVVGYPRIGEGRELKKVLERFWNQEASYDEVENTARDLRHRHWIDQKDAGITFISSNDFSLYDNMLDMALMLNAIPERFRNIQDEHDRYFAMARGTDNAVAMEMTKWFNTNYHYIVPELSADMPFSLNAEKILGEYRDAKKYGIRTKINIVGPITFLVLSKRIDYTYDTLELLPTILAQFVLLLEKIAELDDEIYVQFDEPAVVKDISFEVLKQLASSYGILADVSAKIKIIVMTYFNHATEAVKALKNVPVYGIGLDFIYGKENIKALEYLNGKKLIAGIIDGRNVWKNDYKGSLELLNSIAGKFNKDDIILSTSCSLLHVPYSLEHEELIGEDIKKRMSFAKEKLSELADLAKLVSSNKNEVLESSRFKSVNPNVRERISQIKRNEREGTFAERIAVQKKALGLPLLPTTTIGSFPQTEEIRKLRRDFKHKVISQVEYECGIKNYINACIEFQEDIGLDVLVHGEPERNDMVEYFGEQLDGFVFTKNGWVQSYGSRCVKPPVIYGDVSRAKPMTVDTILYAQSKTKKIVKGMLTGPVTIINWSFVRDDIERSAVCEQISMAIMDEISDLQNAGIKIIQVDEAAFKEGYPLRNAEVADYEEWAIKAFKLAVSSAWRQTQIHTHMCYSDFTDIIHTIEKMDADVITIETSRSGNKMLKVFSDHSYKNQIGPGVYDIHSPRVPSMEELLEKIEQLMRVLPAKKVWINPDCGLKTRKWDEVRLSLVNMVRATHNIRCGLEKG
ncbi:MAG: methionine synthase (B12-independent) [Firmicutes bacterium]|nr:methionine synthase (B12-independent) [Bacillota bacterium]